LKNPGERHEIELNGSGMQRANNGPKGAMDLGAGAKRKQRLGLGAFRSMGKMLE
jgi:hypothetical protein